MFLAGTNEDQVIIILIGDGGTGKSAYINPIAHVLGGYALPSEFQSFVASKGSAGGARGDLAEMEGYRLVYSPEADNREELAESILKVFSGGDKVSARGLYQSQARKFLPSCVIVLTSNKRPLIVGQDDGIWRRIVPIPFDVKIEHATTRILKYNEKALYPEASGILNWLIEGYQMWRSDGRLILPRRVTDEQAMFKASSDILAPFFEEYLNVHVVKALDMSNLSTLYKTYLVYCNRYNQGTRAMNRPNFASALVSRGWKQFPATQGTCFRKTTEVDGRLVVEGLAVKPSYETATLTQERDAQVMGRVKHLHLASRNGSSTLM
jgi:putative DNA primase/helicase